MGQCVSSFSSNPEKIPPSHIASNCTPPTISSVAPPSLPSSSLIPETIFSSNPEKIPPSHIASNCTPPTISSVAPPSSPSSSLIPETIFSTSNWEYKVFLSFRGETRNGFSDHLYRGLCDRMISTFRDSEKLEKGDAITDELKKAIEKSEFAVLVLSPDYARSTWCLDELAHILKCKKQRGTIVLPVFFHVEPTDIRNQTGKYRDAFVEHDTRFEDDIAKVENWRKALKEIAGLCGWHVNGASSEADVIKLIVDRVMDELYDAQSEPNGELVGMDDRINEIESRLELDSNVNDVLTVGIWGMGGIGKTTLAEEVLKKIRNKFDRKLIFKPEPGVKIRLLSPLDLVQCLCKYFLKTSNIESVKSGIDQLKGALSKAKVLIVLDDIVSFGQIESLAGQGTGPLGKNIWGAGSRLIITTRDRSSLTGHPYKSEDDLYVAEKLRIYEVEKLKDEEARQLLCRKVLKNGVVPEEFKGLAESFLQYAEGVPLAHKVLGNFLSEQHVTNWSEILPRLEDDRNEEIFKVLEVSYDELKEETDRKIFLDIACFFYGEETVDVQNVFSGFGYNFASAGITKLVNKSLIKIEGGKLRMHNLIRCMCWHIVRGPKPGERSRLLVDNVNAHKYGGRKSWRFQEARDFLTDNEGTYDIKGLLVNLHKKEDMSLDIDPFQKLKGLKLLKLYNVDFGNVNLKYVSNNLLSLEWHEYRVKSLPAVHLNRDDLVEIKMPNSIIEQLWNDKVSLKGLKVMDFTCCEYLMLTPDFCTVPNLEQLILTGCKKLSKVHQNIGDLKKLRVLNLTGCTSLQSLPRCLSLSSLRTIMALSSPDVPISASFHRLGRTWIPYRSCHHFM